MTADWQPIETAPKDGTWVLACWDRYKIDEQLVSGGCAIVGPIIVRYNDWAWRDGHSTERGGLRLWHPLPPPPETGR